MRLIMETNLLKYNNPFQLSPLQTSPHLHHHTQQPLYTGWLCNTQNMESIHGIAVSRRCSACIWLLSAILHESLIVALQPEGGGVGWGWQIIPIVAVLHTGHRDTVPPTPRRTPWSVSRIIIDPDSTNRYSAR